MSVLWRRCVEGNEASCRTIEALRQKLKGVLNGAALYNAAVQRAENFQVAWWHVSPRLKSVSDLIAFLCH